MANMASRFDVAIAGLGTIGAFACMEAARRGASVIGFDRFRPPHGAGSHSGETRVFRTAYAEHPDYVPLAIRAGELWDELGATAGRTLLHRCGMLSIGPAESQLIRGIRRSAAQYGVGVRELDGAAIRREFPAFAPSDGDIGLFEPAAGWIDVHAAIETALERAATSGAQLALDSPVAGWDCDGNEVRITTRDGEYRAARLIVAAGAWASELLGSLQLPLRVIRKVMVWMTPLEREAYLPGRCPVFAFADSFFYGFPEMPGAGVKLAIHWSDGAVLTGGNDSVPPPGETDLQPVLAMAARYLPGLAGSSEDMRSRVLSAKTCLYTMTPDEHFIVDRHPNSERVYFAAGFSGHGFKFAPAIGAALADLALQGETALPVAFLKLRNPA